MAKYKPVDVAALKELCAKATPGPWNVRIEGTMTGRGPVIFVEGAYYDDGSEFVIAETRSSEVCIAGRWRKVADGDVIEVNGHLIAAARTALPDALDEIEALRGLLSRWLERPLSRELHAETQAAIRAEGSR